MDIYLKIEGVEEKYLRLYYFSKYATGSCPIFTPKELIKEIENICGKGSYCIYNKDGKAISYNEYEKYLHLPRLTYWQQGVKTSVIEQCREVAKELWGNIPEMEIGWLEKQCRTFVD